ncbi:MAG: uroporphyrinogen decarboxylase family protein [Candidatus Latescibacteria bacterium]|nr:uroporphyrinogen decarboxylase family protein [Candidatus Latescibacterota bacterium]
MTNRERLLAVLDGRSPDRVPWIPRLQIWHTANRNRGSLPARFEGMSLREIESVLGMGTPARGGKVFSSVQGGDVEVSSAEEGMSRVTTYRTPAGTVSTRHRRSEELDQAGIGALEIEHMIKGPEDFDAVEYLVRHTEYSATYDDFAAYDAEIGEDGYPLVSAGDCPLHHFLQKLAGYQAGFYMLHDYPDRVERLLETMEEIDRERMWPLVVDSPARLILHGVHLDSMITPPPLFTRYITPYYKDFSAKLHERGKTLGAHLDNDTRLILDHIREAGFDLADTFTTAPQVSCTLEEAREAWGTDVIIWGAVPSVILEDAFSDDAFEATMRGVFRTAAPGDAFVLGVADNVMPNARVDRLERITEMVEKWGDFPIDPAAIDPN